jgi:hypothetical protein
MTPSRIEWMGYNILSQKDEGVDHIFIKVTLSYRGSEVTGEASGPRAPTNFLRLIATATLHGIKKLFPNLGSWCVEEVIPTTKTSTPYVTVVLDLIQPRGSRKFIGTAFIEDDTQKAVGIATLNAINRFVGALQD